MAKGPKISIADQLATIAATSPSVILPRDSVTARTREEVENDVLFEKPQPAPAAAKPEQAKPAEKLKAENATTLPRGLVNTRKRGNVNVDGMKVRQRIEKPHVSLYAHPRVLKKLREIAVAEDCKPHDLYVQGLRLVLKSYGYDLDKLESGEG